MTKLICQRILLKLSGEALMGTKGSIDADIIKRLAAEIKELCDTGLQVGLVIGGGNILRGSENATAEGGNRVSSDHMGMLATVINALAMQNALEFIGQPTRVMSALKINDVCEDYVCRRAIKHLEKGRIVIFAAGTGNPFFTTDSAASLRAIEIKAQLMIKATKVKGVYSTDPNQDPNAIFYPNLTYDQAIDQRLRVMDTIALVLCNDNNLPMRVMNIFDSGALMRLMQGESIGSYIENGNKND